VVLNAPGREVPTEAAAYFRTFCFQGIEVQGCLGLLLVPTSQYEEYQAGFSSTRCRSS
jgi:hypothetical protein